MNEIRLRVLAPSLGREHDDAPAQDTLADEPRKQKDRDALLDILLRLDFAVADEPLQKLIAGGTSQGSVSVDDYRALAAAYARAARGAGEDGWRAGYLARSHGAYACVAMLVGEAGLIARHVEEANRCWRSHQKWLARLRAEKE